MFLKGYASGTPFAENRRERWSGANDHSHVFLTRRKTMIRRIKKASYTILVIFLVLGIAGVAAAGDDMRVVGTIGEDNTITDEAGNIYQIVESEKADEIIEYAGEKVEIMGTVEEADDGSKTIMINDYQLVE
jgi:hypothetical protein